MCREGEPDAQDGRNNSPLFQIRCKKQLFYERRKEGKEEKADDFHQQQRSRGRSSLAAQSAKNRQKPPIYLGENLGCRLSSESQCRKNNFRSSPPAAGWRISPRPLSPPPPLLLASCNIRCPRRGSSAICDEVLDSLTDCRQT